MWIVSISVTSSSCPIEFVFQMAADFYDAQIITNFQLLKYYL